MSKKEDEVKDKKPILKRLGKALKKAFVILSVLGIFTFAGLAIKGYIDNSKYISNAEIEQNFVEFGVENPYVFQGAISNEYKRLAYNEGEPIYVSFSKEFENNEMLKDSAIYALDYLFGILNEINPNYYYKLVSNKELQKQKLLGKSTITYQMTSLIGENIGVSFMELNAHDLAYWDFISNSNNIYINRSEIKYYDDIMKSTKKNYQEKKIKTLNLMTNWLIHETMHAFGFADVYHLQGAPEFMVNAFEGLMGMDKFDLDADHSDTFLDPKKITNSQVEWLTPKDYATLCALYMQNVPEYEQADELIRLSQMINVYTSVYEDWNFNQTFKGIKDSLEFLGAKDENFGSCADISEVEFVTYFYSNANGTEVIINNIQIDDGKYKFAALDNDGKILHSCEGEIYKTEDFIVLKDFDYKKVSELFEESDKPGRSSDAYLYRCDNFIPDVWLGDNNFAKGHDCRLWIKGGTFSATIDHCKNVVFQNEASIE